MAIIRPATAVDFSGRDDGDCAWLLAYERPEGEEYVVGKSAQEPPLRAEGDIGVGGGAFGIDGTCDRAAASEFEEADDESASSSSHEAATGPAAPGRPRSLLDRVRESNEASVS